MTMPTDPIPLPLPASSAPVLDDAGAAAQRQLAVLGARSRHWQRTRRLSFVLLALWLAATFCSVFFARELAALSLFGWPLSFYLAAQGTALVYLAIVGAYAAGVHHFDRRYARELGPGAAHEGKTARGETP